MLMIRVVLLMQRVDGANLPWLTSDNGIVVSAEGTFVVQFTFSFRLSNI